MIDLAIHKITDYKVITTIKAIGDLERQVIAEIERGYIPWGGVSFSQMGMPWQAMVKIELK